MKLIPAANVTAARKNGYWKPKTMLHIQAPNRKIIPPPRRTIDE